MFFYSSKILNTFKVVKRKINKEGGADGGRVMILDLKLMEVEIILQTLVLPFYLFIYLELWRVDQLLLVNS